jgi:hypothetical protein
MSPRHTLHFKCNTRGPFWDNLFVETGLSRHTKVIALPVVCQLYYYPNYAKRRGD